MKCVKVLILAIVLLTLTILLTCCITAKSVEYPFPELGEVERINDGKQIYSMNANGEVVFRYDIESDMVSIPSWYWIKIMNYGINTGGIKN